MNDDALMRGPGRPKDRAKRAAIVGAANTLFMERGYAGVTMEAVAAMAGVSKMTVYGHFQDKAALFGAVVRFNTEQMVAGLTGLDQPEGQAGLEARLVSYGTALLTLILSPRIAAMSHVLMGMLMKNPAMAETFYAAGPGHGRAVLAAFLAESARRGELDIDSAQAAADDLVALWEGDLPKRVAMGLAPPGTPEDIARRVQRGTRVFLRAYRVDGG